MSIPVFGLEITLRVGCPNNCDYCPQATLLRVYKGNRCFTLEGFQHCLTVGQVPVLRNLTFAGAGEPFLCPDAARIMQWAMLERGHHGSISTTLRGASIADVEAVAGLPFTSTVIHVPDSEGQMHLTPDDHWLKVFERAIRCWRCHAEFIVTVYGPLHPRVGAVCDRYNLQVRSCGPHDRSGTLAGLPHRCRETPVPLCGKLFCSHLFPNGDVARCCNDYGMDNVWGNLYQTTYRDLYRTQKFRDYVKSLTDPEVMPRCRQCQDGYNRYVNLEDRDRTYDCPEPTYF